MPSLLYFWGPGPSFLLSPRDRSALSFYITCSLLLSCQRTCCLLSSPTFLISAVLATGLLYSSYFFFFCVSSGSCPCSHVPQLSWEKVNISLPFSARVIMHSWPQHKAHSCILWLLLAVYLLLQYWNDSHCDHSSTKKRQIAKKQDCTHCPGSNT